MTAPQTTTLETGWTWQQTEQGQFLRCELLQAWEHGFFTRQFSPQSLDQLTAYLQPTAQAHRIRQVHGNTIVTTSEIQAAGITTLDYAAQLPADALISTAPNQALWVCSADCVPLLIGDLKTGQVAAIHAGWRGTAEAITPLTIQKMQALSGSPLSDFRVALGPTITGENYQVELDVAIRLGKTLLPPGQQDSTPPDTILKRLEDLPNSPLRPDPMPGRVRLDVGGVNVHQLLQLGLTPAQITQAPYCTFSHPEYFFSYRREHLKQVQWSGIVAWG